MKGIRAVFFSLVAAIAALMPSVTAYAASDPCGIGGTSSPMALTNDISLCQNTHGVGTQLTIENGGCAIISFHDHTVNGFVYVSMVDGNGNCIRERSNNGVYVESGNCNVDGSNPDFHELWIESPFSDGCEFENGGAHNFMIVTNNKAGNKVWGGLNNGGNWFKWAV